MPDSVAILLGATQTSDRNRAAAWDAYYQSANVDDLSSRLRELSIPESVKAQLWDWKAGAQKTVSAEDFAEQRTEMNLADKAAQWLPEIGGALGGIVGMAGGPAGAIGGAALGGAAGESYKQLINRARGTAPTPNTPAEALNPVATQGAVQGGAQAVGAGIAPVMSGLGTRLMQSAVKPGVRLLLKRGARAPNGTPRLVQTLLDEGINVTESGAAKLRDLLKMTNDKIDDMIAGVRGDVAPTNVTRRLTDTAKTYGNQVNPQADLDAISDVGNNFLDMTAGRPITIQDAQKLKRGTYARIGEKYGKSGAASIEAEKALARGLKEEVAQAVPGVSELNAREGNLIEALDAVGRRVAVAGNRDPVGFAWVAHNPTTFLAALIDRNPTIKSLLARGLYKGAAAQAQVSPQLIRVALHSIATDDPNAALSETSGGQSPR